MENKKGQVTIFIIVAIMIVVGIIIAIMLMGKIDTEPSVILGPQEFIDKCVKDSVENSVEKMLKNGGEISATQWIDYNGTQWNYLCYQADYYQACYNIHPMLELQIESEIEKNIKDDIDGCFDEMKEEFEDRGYDVNIGNGDGSVDLLPGYIKIDLKR